MLKDTLARLKSTSDALKRSNSKWKVFDLLKKPPQTDAEVSVEDPGEVLGEDMVNNCQCCDTVVIFPKTFPKYRCLVCNTTNIIIGTVDDLYPDKEVPHPMSLSHIKKLIERCLQTAEQCKRSNQAISTHDIFEPLSSYLHQACRTFACLNSSFKIKKSSRKVHRSGPNIKSDDVKEAFMLLTKLPTSRPLYLALLGLSSLLKRVYLSMPDDPKNLYWIMIVLEIPFLSHALIHTEKKSMLPVPMLAVAEIRAMCYDIVKRLIGILSHSMSPAATPYLSSWFARMDFLKFASKVDLINLYITFHLKKYFLMANNPEVSRRGSATGSHPRLHPTDREYFESSVLKNDIEAEQEGRLISTNLPPNTSKKGKKDTKVRIHQYGTDWHLKTACMVLLFCFRANRMRHEADRLLVSAFYNSLVDFVNIKLDFDFWQSSKKFLNTKKNQEQPELQTVIDYIHGHNSFKYNDKASFFFCNYPILVSLGGKITILEYEARRQMERKAEEAFIDSLDKKKVFDLYFKVRVRREYIVQDSLHCIKTNTANLKKSLRVQFVNEPGVDAGGLKKDWFLNLTKVIFDPSAGMLTNVDESNLLWFNLVPVDNHEIYYLFGSILGLAIYNSTILDLRFPSAMYKLLLGHPVGFGDYQQLFPESAINLSKLLDYPPNVIESLGLTFEVNFKDLFGRLRQKELVAGGSRRYVSDENKHEYVERYCQFFMYDGIANQVQLFVKGFSTVVSGNALSLFLPEEIELLLCGNDEGKLNVEILRSITKYVGFNGEPNQSQLVTWFWEYANGLTYSQQKKLLRFVTGSDRVPATGLQNMAFKISMAGSRDTERLPIAHTCFNELALYNYKSKEKMVRKLNIAINESAGFGLK